MTARRGSSRPARVLAIALLIAALTAMGCGPEASRSVGGGRGADPGNRDYPLPQLHGDQAKNNPSFEVPDEGLAPRDAKGVPGFWARPGQPE